MNAVSNSAQRHTSSLMERLRSAHARLDGREKIDLTQIEEQFLAALRAIDVRKLAGWRKVEELGDKVKLEGFTVYPSAITPLELASYFVAPADLSLLSFTKDSPKHGIEESFSARVYFRRTDDAIEIIDFDPQVEGYEEEGEEAG